MNGYLPYVVHIVMLFSGTLTDRKREVFCAYRIFKRQGYAVDSNRGSLRSQIQNAIALGERRRVLHRRLVIYCATAVTFVREPPGPD